MDLAARFTAGFDLASAALVDRVRPFFVAGFTPCLAGVFVLETGLTTFAWEGLLGVGLALPARRDLRILIWGGAGLAETDLANFERLRLAAGAFSLAGAGLSIRRACSALTAPVFL